ncbi:MAG TPA: hypothetical protein V6D17_10085 [Candidatus Obscuribacterales bacterium]
MGAEYLNVDVEVRSHADLAPLRDQLGDSVDLMFCGETSPGEFLLTFERHAADLADPNPDKTAIALCKLIEHLHGPAKQLWDSAEDRVFDVGFEAVSDVRCGRNLLSAETMLRIARLNARLAISVYTHSQPAAAACHDDKERSKTSDKKQSK